MLVARAVVADRRTVDRRLDVGHGDLAAHLDRVGTGLQGRQGTTRVATGHRHQVLKRFVRERHRTVQTARVGHGPTHHGLDVVVGQRLQVQDQRPRQQRCHDRERRVLGGRGDQQHDAILDRVEQRVLLGLGEAVDLVDEQDGLLPVCQSTPRHVDDRADLFDPRRQRRQRLETAARGLADQEAIVVLPVPGGPYSITDAAPDPAISRRSGARSPSRCC